MSIFSRFFGRESATSSASNSNLSADYNGRVVYVGNEDSALKVASVFRAVSLISDSIASLPLIYKRLVASEQYFKPYTEMGGAKLYALLTIRPNKRQTAFIFFKNLVLSVLLRGNAYAYLRRDVAGEPMELILLSPWSVSYDILNDLYHVNDPYNSVIGTYTSDDILHFKNISNDGGYMGVSTISYAAQTLGIAATADKETLTRFATGGKVKGLFHNDYSTRGFGEYQDDQLENRANSIQASLDAGKDIIAVPGDGKFDQLSLSAVDMQFLENKKFTVTEIARFFNVPKAKLFDDSNANYKSSEMSTIEFYSDCLDPILTMIEKEFTAKLVPMSLMLQLKFKYDLSKLYTTDLTTRATWQSKQIANGLASVNDLRRSEDLAPVEGGDKIFISCNVRGIEETTTPTANKVG